MNDVPDISRTPDFEYWALLASIIISTLAFGSVELWSLALMEFIIATGVVIFLIRSAKGIFPCYSVPGIIPLFLLLTYMAAQALPLPPSLLRILSPTAFEIYSATVLPHSPDSWTSIALSGRGLMMEFFRFASYVGVYVLTFMIMTRASSLKRITFAVAGFVSILALVSIIAYYTSGSEILWLRETPGIGFPYGPFINKNHYAGFMGMTLPLVMGAFLISRPRMREGDIRSRIAYSLSSRRINRHVMYGMGAVAIMISLLLSQSRSGVTAMLVSVCLFAALLMREKRSGKTWVALIVMSLMLSLVWFEIAPLVERFQIIMGTDGSMFGARRIILFDSIRAARDFVLTGGGFGSFEHIYPAYRTFKGSLLVDHAHNDYIEFFVEGGFISTVLALWFAISVVRHVLREFPRRRNSVSIYVFYSCVSGILYMLLHALTDFNFHVGANGLIFFFLLGMAVAASYSSSRGGNHARLASYNRNHRYAALFIAVVLGCTFIWVNTRMLMASRDYNRYKEVSASSKLSDARKILERAVSLDGLNPIYRVKLAAEEADEFSFIESERNMGIALRHSPLCGLCLQSLAYLKDVSGESEAARNYLYASMRYGARWTNKYLRYASWLSVSGHYKEAIDIYSEGIEAEPERAVEYIDSMFRSGLSFDVVYESIPQTHEARLALAQNAVSSGLGHEASTLLDGAFSIMSEFGRGSAIDYSKMYWMNVSLKRYSQAYDAASVGADRFSNNSNLRTLLAIELERAGKSSLALDAYRYALGLNPSNITARKGVERLGR